jgi:hypothetical protein
VTVLTYQRRNPQPTRALGKHTKQGPLNFYLPEEIFNLQGKDNSKNNYLHISGGETPNPPED